MQTKAMGSTFTGACKDFFGFRPGTGLKDFGEELKALNEQDRAEITAGLIANGYPLEPVAQVIAA